MQEALRIFSQGNGLDAMVQNRRILIPATAVERIIEYEVVGLPLSKGFVSGLGVYKNALLISLHLFEAERDPNRRLVSGALLKMSNVTCCVALEITRIISLVPVQKIGAPLGPWMSEVETTDGRVLPWLNVSQMLADLGVSATG